MYRNPYDVLTHALVYMRHGPRTRRRPRPAPVRRALRQLSDWARTAPTPPDFVVID